MTSYINEQMVDGETSPPPLLTEADLIALMDKHGIGKTFLLQIDLLDNYSNKPISFCVPFVVECF